MWRIITWHGSLLSLDKTNAAIAHAESTESGIADLDPLYVDEGWGLQIGRDGDVENGKIIAGPLEGYEVKKCGLGFSLSKNNKFLSAEPGVRAVTPNRDRSGEWETFFLSTGPNQINDIFQILILDGGKIPDEIPQIFKDNMSSIRQFHPHARYHLFSGDDARQFIEENFDRDVVDAYDTMRPYSFKVDLAIYCLLFRYGGLYSDIGVRFINSVVAPPGTNFVYFRDLIHVATWGISAALLYARPGLEEFSKAIHAVVVNCRNRYYGYSPLCVVSNIVLGQSIALVDRPASHYAGEFKSLTPGMQNPNLAFVSPKGEIVALRYKGNNAGGILNVSGSNNYIDLWNARQVYTD